MKKLADISAFESLGKMASPVNQSVFNKGFSYREEEDPHYKKIRDYNLKADFLRSAYGPHSPEYLEHLNDDEARTEAMDAIDEKTLMERIKDLASSGYSEAKWQGQKAGRLLKKGGDIISDIPSRIKHGLKASKKEAMRALVYYGLNIGIPNLAVVHIVDQLSSAGCSVKEIWKALKEYRAVMSDGGDEGLLEDDYGQQVIGDSTVKEIKSKGLRNKISDKVKSVGKNLGSIAAAPLKADAMLAGAALSSVNKIAGMGTKFLKGFNKPKEQRDKIDIRDKYRAKYPKKES